MEQSLFDVALIWIQQGGPGQNNCHNGHKEGMMIHESPHTLCHQNWISLLPKKQSQETLPPQNSNSNTYSKANWCEKSKQSSTKLERKAMSQEKKEQRGIDIGSSFKLNVHAPEYVPKSLPQLPASGYFYPYLPFLGNGGYGLSPDWFYFGDLDPMQFMPNSHVKITGNPRSNNDVAQKIVKQVEYQLSDTNLVASDFLMKIMSKDPEGYVPMSVIASWKKIKSFGANHQTLVKALKTSTKLVVSDDGKKIRRKQAFTERDREELQSRTVVVENLPDDHSRQNLEKIFSVAGRVKNVRICHPQEPTASKSAKSDLLISNKLHAFVEYETTDQADKAVEKLNDERNWRKGLRVRSMLRRSPKSVIRNKRPDFDHFDVYSEDDQSPQSQTSGSSTHIEQILENNIDENQNAAKKSWGRGRTKCHGAGPTTDNSNSMKVTSQGPRMPDGTRGFTMGRGKPLPVLTTAGLGSVQL